MERHKTAEVHQWDLSVEWEHLRKTYLPGRTLATRPQMPPHTSEPFSSFPDDVPTAPLVTINLQRLLNNGKEEHARLFEASKSLGFFYLDLSGCEAGETLLHGSDDMFNLIEHFYALPLDEKRRYDFAAEGSYFGYKGMGAEVIDGKGTRDRNEIYNVGYQSYTATVAHKHLDLQRRHPLHQLQNPRTRPYNSKS